jgi:PPOX class probable F420-dependent enzyme/deazaflavin-dependent oxidoreductase (nitroreductase family)
MAKQYRVTAFRRIYNTIITSLLRMGVPIGSFALLTVRGRKSGRPIQTPVAIFVQAGSRYLVAPYGVVNWVRNLQAAAGGATLTLGRHSEKIRATELEKDAAAFVFRDALRSGPPGIPAVITRWYRDLFVLPYLGVTENASLEEFEREVQIHPVFLIQSAWEQADEQVGEARSQERRKEIMTTQKLPQALATLVQENFVCLTTFRKNGSPVPTPVWFAQHQGVIYIYTESHSGKIQRIHHTSRVTLAPCSATGKIKGPAIEGHARLVSDAQERADAQAALAKKYGLGRKVFYPLRRALQALQRKSPSEVYVAIEGEAVK